MKTGILHLGLGGFHRAHQAAFTQDAVAAEGGNWGIEAVSMRNPALAEALNARGGRFTLIERHPHGPERIDMTVIRRAHALPGNAGGVAARMADPAIHVVTITVTEKGYGADIGARALNRSDAGVAHDLNTPEDPKSLVGLLCLGLAQRRAAGLGGLTVMSCDNLPENGRFLEAIVQEFAQATDPALAGWIEETCAFPNAMVDRITPAATDETIALAGGDPVAIETEPFRQWVIEDRFAGPRPAWEAAGALIVPDVAPFELMKLRMLNGAHSLAAYLGALAGLPAMRDVMAVPELAHVIRAHMEAAATTLDPAEGLDPAAYADALIDRFANPAIDHRCLQIAMDGSQKLPQRIFAPTLVLLDRKHNTATYALAIAAWIQFAQGSDTAGNELPLNDPLAEQIRQALARAGGDWSAQVKCIAEVEGLAHFGVLDHEEFARNVSAHLMAFDRMGIVGALTGLKHTRQI